MTKEVNTEGKIIQAALEVFLEKGKAGARMQEIADRAGINKALLHYYFRSKELLFKAVFKEIVGKVIPKLTAILKSEDSLQQKIRLIVSTYIDVLSSNPTFPLFMLNELRRAPDQLFQNIGLFQKSDFQILQNQIKTEVELGTIRPISTAEFMLNLMSLTIFPFVAQPVLQQIFEISSDEYQKLIQRRKKEIPVFILNALKP